MVKYFETLAEAEAEAKTLKGWHNIAIGQVRLLTGEGYKTEYYIACNGGILHADGYIRTDLFSKGWEK